MILFSFCPVKIFAWWLSLLMLSCISNNYFMIAKAAKVCTLKQFERGEWKYMPEKTEKDYICCSDLTVNMSKEVKDACIKQNVHFPSSFCNCDFRANTVLTISERAKWRWVPEADCVLLDITPQRFCDLLGDHTIGVFGDSTMDQIMYSLKGYLHATSCVDSILPRLPYEVPQMGVNNLLYKQLGAYSPKKKIDILVMNIGMWYENMTMLEEGMQFLQDDTNYLQSLSRNDPNNYHDISYLWRLNTVPSSPSPSHCNKEYLHPPFTDHFTESQKFEFGWNVFPSYDLHVREIMEALQIPILEVTNVLTMHPDAHIAANNHKYDDDFADNAKTNNNTNSSHDCVHSCLAGSGANTNDSTLFVLLSGSTFSFSSSTL